MTGGSSRQSPPVARPSLVPFSGVCMPVRCSSYATARARTCQWQRERRRRRIHPTESSRIPGWRPSCAAQSAGRRKRIWTEIAWWLSAVLPVLRIVHTALVFAQEVLADFLPRQVLAAVILRTGSGVPQHVRCMRIPLHPLRMKQRVEGCQGYTDVTRRAPPPPARRAGRR